MSGPVKPGDPGWYPPGRPIRMVVRAPVGEWLWDIPHRDLFKVHRVRKDHVKWSGFFSQAQAARIMLHVQQDPNSRITFPGPDNPWGKDGPYA